MDLNQLKAFIIVAEELSITRAAQRLCLSQPAISAQIKALETEFDITLFKRTSRGMELTENGSLLKTEAQNVLNAANNFLNTARTLNDDEHCSLGTIALPEHLNLTDLLSKLRKEHPHINLSIKQSISGEIIDGILNREFDSGFIMGRLEHVRIGIIKICPINFVIVGPWSWKSRLETMDWSEVLELPWIATPEKCSLFTITREYFEKNKTKMTSYIAADQEHMLIELVKNQTGVTIIQENLAIKLQEQKQLYIWPKDKAFSHLYFIWDKEKESIASIKALIHIIQQNWAMNT